VTVQTPGQPPRQVPITRQSISGEMPVPHRIYTTQEEKGRLLLLRTSTKWIDERVVRL